MILIIYQALADVVAVQQKRNARSAIKMAQWFP
jgi:hypothetical protein